MDVGETSGTGGSVGDGTTVGVRVGGVVAVDSGAPVGVRIGVEEG